jgi:hypothetical protein
MKSGMEVMQLEPNQKILIFNFLQTVIKKLWKKKLVRWEPLVIRWDNKICYRS